MNQNVLKYLLDILSVIDELEIFKSRVNHDFNVFSKDFMATRTAERNLEIIGEALNKLIKLDANLKIKDAKKVIGLRNLIIHSYDSVNHEIIWGILIKNIPTLRVQIEEIRHSY